MLQNNELTASMAGSLFVNPQCLYQCFAGRKKQIRDSGGIAAFTFAGRMRHFLRKDGGFLRQKESEIVISATDVISIIKQ